MINAPSSSFDISGNKRKPFDKMLWLNFAAIIDFFYTSITSINKIMTPKLIFEAGFISFYRIECECKDKGAKAIWNKYKSLRINVIVVVSFPLVVYLADLDSTNENFLCDKAIR